jgi:hypothetical protein
MAAFFSIALLAALVGSPVCHPVRTGQVAVIPTERAAISSAKIVWAKQFGASSINGPATFHAQLSGGVWHVFGALPVQMIGGTPEANICQSSGIVLKVWHTQ